MPGMDLIRAMQQLPGLPRRQIAITSASVTNCAVISELIDQPTIRRENKSSTTAAYSQPSSVRM